jgi:hypothetical protein
VLTPEQKKQLAAKFDRRVEALGIEFYGRLIDFVGVTDLIDGFGLPQATDEEVSQSTFDVLDVLVPIAIKAAEDAHKNAEP